VPLEIRHKKWLSYHRFPTPQYVFSEHPLAEAKVRVREQKTEISTKGCYRMGVEKRRLLGNEKNDGRKPCQTTLLNMVNEVETLIKNRVKQSRIYPLKGEPLDWWS